MYEETGFKFEEIMLKNQRENSMKENSDAEKSKRGQRTKLYIPRMLTSALANCWWMANQEGLCMQACPN